MVPRTKSAVILLTNTEHIPADSLHSTILNLLLDDQKKQGTPHVPKVNGPSPIEAALNFFHQMQAGKVDRDKLGEEFGLFLTDERLKAAAPRLKALGEPDKVEVVSVYDAGAWRSPRSISRSRRSSWEVCSTGRPMERSSSSCFVNSDPDASAPADFSTFRVLPSAYADPFSGSILWNSERGGQLIAVRFHVFFECFLDFGKSCLRDSARFLEHHQEVIDLIRQDGAPNVPFGAI